MKSYECLDFCDAFAENNYRISYGFRTLTKTGNHSFVFIDQNYWKLGFTDNTDDDNKTLELFADEGKTSNWFGSQYSMAFCVWFSDKCKAGLVKVCLPF